MAHSAVRISNLNNSANVKQNLKKMFLSKQEPKWGRVKNKTRGQKFHATVPLDHSFGKIPNQLPATRRKSDQATKLQQWPWTSLSSSLRCPQSDIKFFTGKLLELQFWYSSLLKDLIQDTSSCKNCLFFGPVRQDLFILKIYMALRVCYISVNLHDTKIHVQKHVLKIKQFWLNMKYFYCLFCNIVLFTIWGKILTKYSENHTGGSTGWYVKLSRKKV